VSASSQRYGFAAAGRDAGRDGDPRRRPPGALGGRGRRSAPQHRLGRPGFVTPAHVREAAKRAIDAGKTHYERNGDLKRAIAAKLARDHDLHVDPEDGLLVTAGAHQALYEIFRAWIEPGDEVLIGDPGSYYDANVRANGGVPVPVPLRPERGFKMDPADVEARITPRTKMLAITNPEAPAASVHDRADLERLADLALRHDLLVVSDELYEAITFEPGRTSASARFPAWPSARSPSTASRRPGR
jgi:aspartate/methionine/tyrosine aminotransferase